MSTSVGTHLSAEVLAAYLERSLTVDERERTEEHLAGCDQCRREVGQAWRLVAGRRRRRTLAFGAPATVAAAAAVILLWVGPLGTNDPAEPAVRDNTSSREAVTTFSVVRPSPGSVVDPAQVGFEWQALDGDVTYSLTLTSGNGATIWTTGTAETAATLPASVVLARGALFLWFVDALYADGRSATSEVQSFTTSQ